MADAKEKVNLMIDNKTQNIREEQKGYDRELQLSRLMLLSQSSSPHHKADGLPVIL